jgi:molybdopterin molybdotransferase
MIRVEEAEKIILSQLKDYGTETIVFDQAAGRVLAENIIADRDFPAFNRVTMDGIAISYDAFENGIYSFRILSAQAAGNIPPSVNGKDECVEIMTGAALPASTDTIIPYEDLQIDDGIATIKNPVVRKGQNIHWQGKDKKQHEILVPAGELINPPVIAIMAAVGKQQVLVRKLPKTIVITTGDELVRVQDTPAPFQLRSSNDYLIQAVLQEHYLPVTTRHLPDDKKIITDQLKKWLIEYEVIILSGGVSMGKFDYLPAALEELGVLQLFHKVQQRPGKPFWFGTHPAGNLVFAFPGNPVSAFLCLHRYFIPWLKASLGLQPRSELSAALDRDISFSLPLQYFLQVNIYLSKEGYLLATPAEGNGSGDFANLLQSNAFMELPVEESNFRKETQYPIWPFKQII